MMRWQLKAAVQALLSRIPGSRSVYRTLQRLTGSNRLDILDQYGMKSTFLNRFNDQLIAIEGKEFVEIGTGWYPLLPLLLFVLGAKRVVTLDTNPWLTLASLRETIDGLTSIRQRIQQDFGASCVDMDAKLDELHQAVSARGATVDEVLRLAHIEYRMPCSACDTGLAVQSVDYVISSNVFEHLPPNVIEACLVESRRYLKPGGLHLHHINPGDHFAFDPRITTVNFLRYSPGQWYYIGGSGLAYHNRLRGIDYLKMFERAGFTITYEAAQVDRAALAKLASGELRVDPNYAGYSHEELACYLIDIFAVHEAPAMSQVRD